MADSPTNTAAEPVQSFQGIVEDMHVSLDSISHTLLGLEAWINLIVSDPHGYTTIPRSFMGPSYTTSHNLGPSLSLWISGDVEEAYVPLMICAEWPPGSQPRHAVIYLRPSIRSDYIEQSINKCFKVMEHGREITKAVFFFGTRDALWHWRTSYISRASTIGCRGYPS